LILCIHVTPPARHPERDYAAPEGCSDGRSAKDLYHRTRYAWLFAQTGGESFGLRSFAQARTGVDGFNSHDEASGEVPLLTLLTLREPRGWRFVRTGIGVAV
jgi:hypothetical protein